MDKIEKIRQEIKELGELLEDHNYYLDNSEQALGYSAALDDIEKFLSTLESEKPMQEGLEEEISRYLRVECSSDDEPSVSEIARHFAKWGAEHAREHMMKEAVEGEVKDFCFVREVNYSSAKIEFSTIPELKVGDKVRVIVLPKED